MNHPDPLARGWPGRGRAAVGFVRLRIRPGRPWSILSLLGGVLPCWGGERRWICRRGGMRMRMAQAIGGGRFVPLKCRLRHPFSQTAPVFGAPGLCHLPAPSQELHLELSLHPLPMDPGSLGAPPSPPALTGHPQNASTAPRKGELQEVPTKPLRSQQEERA